MPGDNIPVVFSSASQEWYTPALYIEAARRVLNHFDLDPASCEKANITVKASSFMTKADDGLSKPWIGKVFCNPPYGGGNGRNTGTWVTKMINEFTNGNMSEGILLVNAVTDRKWYQPLFNYPICFTQGRIKFETPEGTPKSPISGNSFIYFGPNPNSFANEFSKFGNVVIRMQPP